MTVDCVQHRGNIKMCTLFNIIMPVDVTSDLHLALWFGAESSNDRLERIAAYISYPISALVDSSTIALSIILCASIYMYIISYTVHVHVLNGHDECTHSGWDTITLPMSGWGTQLLPMSGWGTQIH